MKLIKKLKEKFNITPLEIFIVFIFLVGLGFYFAPKLALSVEQRQYGIIQTNAAMMTSKILAEFSDNLKKQKPSEIAQKLTAEMNKLCKNPVDKKEAAYALNEECLGCVTVSPDDKVKNIILTSKDKEGKLIVRTIIQPPSFVTFNKDLKNGDSK